MLQYTDIIAHTVREHFQTIFGLLNVIMTFGGGEGVMAHDVLQFRSSKIFMYESLGVAFCDV